MTQVSTEMKFASAVSDEPLLDAALTQATTELRAQLGGAVDIAMVFATSHHAHGFNGIHEHLARTLAPAHTLAVTTEGVIAPRREVQQGPGLVVFAASLPSAKIELEWMEQLPQPRIKNVKALMIVADPFSMPMQQLLPTLHEALPGVAIVGGMASGARKAGGNRLMVDGQVRDSGAIALAIGGDIRVDVTVSQGCRPIGKPLVITKSKRNVILELAGRRALTVVSDTIEALGENDRHLVRSSGLLVGRVIDEYKSRFGRGDFLIRNLLGYDEESGYVAVNDAFVKTGQTIQFHLRDQLTAREDFNLLLEAQKLHGPGSGALVFSCNGRGLNLFDAPHADAQMIHDALGDMPLAGFFAAGEIGPVGDQVFLHGHTVCLMVFRPANG